MGNQVRALHRGHPSFWTTPRRLHTAHVNSTQRPTTQASWRARTQHLTRSIRHTPDLLPAVSRGTRRIAPPAVSNVFDNGTASLKLRRRQDNTRAFMMYLTQLNIQVAQHKNVGETLHQRVAACWLGLHVQPGRRPSNSDPHHHRNCSTRFGRYRCFCRR